MSLGIQVDRDTVRNWTITFQERAKELASVTLMGSPMAINVIKLLFDVDTVGKLKERYPDEIYDTVSDETYPTKRGAKKKFRKENRERKARGEKPKKFPESFTLATSYLPSLSLFASVLLSNCAFNSLLALCLFAPLNGSDMNLTDGNPAYNVVDREDELFHKFKNTMKRDPTFNEMRRAKLPPDEIIGYLKDRYSEMRSEHVDRLKRKYPDLVGEDGEFLGHVDTNAVEGGNWRIKYNLRTSYLNGDVCLGRVLLGLINDSMFTFKNGRPDLSFGHINSEFRYGKVMSIRAGVGKSVEEDETGMSEHIGSMDLINNSPMFGVA